MLTTLHGMTTLPSFPPTPPPTHSSTHSHGKSVQQQSPLWWSWRITGLWMFVVGLKAFEPIYPSTTKITLTLYLLLQAFNPMTAGCLRAVLTNGWKSSVIYTEKCAPISCNIINEFLYILYLPIKQTVNYVVMVSKSTWRKLWFILLYAIFEHLPCVKISSKEDLSLCTYLYREHWNVS